MNQYKYLQYQVCVKMCHICSSRPGLSARCTDYALRTGLSGLSLVSACCQSESSRLGRPGDFGPLSGRRTLRAPLPAVLVHALPRARDRCNLESSNGTLGTPHCLRTPPTTGVREARPQSRRLCRVQIAPVRRANQCRSAGSSSANELCRPKSPR